jgi:hypothetical protein
MQMEAALGAEGVRTWTTLLRHVCRAVSTVSAFFRCVARATREERPHALDQVMSAEISTAPKIRHRSPGVAASRPPRQHASRRRSTARLREIVFLGMKTRLSEEGLKELAATES